MNAFQITNQFKFEILSILNIAFFLFLFSFSSECRGRGRGREKGGRGGEGRRGRGRRQVPVVKGWRRRSGKRRKRRRRSEGRERGRRRQRRQRRRCEGRGGRQSGRSARRGKKRSGRGGSGSGGRWRRVAHRPASSSSVVHPCRQHRVVRTCRKRAEEKKGGAGQKPLSPCPATSGVPTPSNARKSIGERPACETTVSKNLRSLVFFFFCTWSERGAVAGHSALPWWS